MAAPRPELWRINDRRTFQTLRQNGRRIRRGPLAVTWLAPSPGSTAPPRAGFALGRSVGGAVLRNRIRRRLRAALRELQAQGRLPAGTYLLGGGPELAELPWSALVELLEATLDEVSS
ncbi:MAG: ribonuclease P protein component [Acidimicrobiales bacterium]